MSIDRRIQRTPSHSAARSSQEWNPPKKWWGPIIPYFLDPNRCGRYWGGNLFMLGLRMFEFMEWKQLIQRTVERAIKEALPNSFPTRGVSGHHCCCRKPLRPSHILTVAPWKKHAVASASLWWVRCQTCDVRRFWILRQIDLPGRSWWGGTWCNPCERRCWYVDDPQLLSLGC